MDSKMVRNAAAALLVALTLAALAWAIKSLVEATAILNAMIVNTGVDGGAARILVFIIALIVVAGLAAGGYFLFDKQLKPKEEEGSEE